jgi:hypothetical protein
MRRTPPHLRRYLAAFAVLAAFGCDSAQVPDGTSVINLATADITLDLGGASTTDPVSFGGAAPVGRSMVPVTATVSGGPTIDVIVDTSDRQDVVVTGDDAALRAEPLVRYGVTSLYQRSVDSFDISIRADDEEVFDYPDQDQNDVPQVLPVAEHSYTITLDGRAYRIEVEDMELVRILYVTDTPADDADPHAVFGIRPGNPSGPEDARVFRGVAM